MSNERLTFDQFFMGISSLKKILTKGAPDIDELTARLMFKVFEHLTLSQWSYVISASATTFKFWPAPAEMLELLTGTKADVAETTAAALCDCVTRYGSQATYYETRILPRIGLEGDALVRRKGGWLAFCALTDDTPLGVFKKQLVDELEATIARDKREALMPPEMRQQLASKVQDDIARLADRFSLAPSPASEQRRGEN